MASGSSSATSPDASRSVSEVRVSGTSAFPRAVAPDTRSPDVGGNTRATASLTPLDLSPSVYHAPWWGIQLYGQNLHVDKLEQVGAGWLRVPLEWAPIEPDNTTPENFQWPATLDAQLAQASAKNIQVILTLKGNPSWAATYPSGPIDKVDISELVEFMEAAVARYGTPPYNVKYWEIYNEPDNTREGRATHDGGGYGYFGRTPGKYVYILRNVYGPMKEVDPQAQVVFGGLAYEPQADGFAADFVDEVMERGAGPYFDVMNFHYFPNFREQWEQYGIGIGIIGKANYLRNLVTSFGVLHKAYICTETCMWSNESEGGSDELQSRHVVQVFVRSKEADLDMTNWFWLYDDRNLHKCGLYDLDRNPKPASDAFRTLSRQLYSAQYVGSIDPGETGSSQIEAYGFVTPAGSSPFIVAWTNDESTHQMSLETDQLIMVDKYGNGTTINDGDDGVVDGYVQVDLGPSPVYLRFQREYILTAGTNGHGTVHHRPGNPYYDGEVATLEPNPDTGWEFSQWSGPNAGEVIENDDGTWSLTMNGNKTVTATFTLKQHILTTGTVGEGTVSHTPGNPYTYGDVATLEPMPAAGWTFNGWTGTDAQDLINNRDGTWSLTMDGDKAVTARFIQDELAVLLTVDIEGQGAVIDTPGNPYLEGEVATLEPSPDRGWSFDDWSGPNAGEVIDNDDGTWSLTMDGDKTLTARFNEKEYFVTVTTSGRGTVEHEQRPYRYGEVATLKPIPAADHRFAGWSGPDARDLTYNVADGTWWLSMDEDKAVTARFAKQTVFLPLVPAYFSH